MNAALGAVIGMVVGIAPGGTAEAMSHERGHLALYICGGAGAVAGASATREIVQAIDKQARRIGAPDRQAEGGVQRK